ncbi:MAG TPA: mannosyltransferase family protein [Acidimicrobiales bacterium]
MAEVDVRTRTSVRPQPDVPERSNTLLRLGERAGRRVWPTAKALARPVALYVVSRVAIALAIGLVIDLNLGLAQHQFNGPWPTNPPGRPLFEALGMWDGGWYMRIAHNGYSTSLHPLSPYTPTVAFLPLLPVLLRITTFLTGLNVLYAGVLTSAVIGVVASAAVWFFVRHLTDSRTADRATALFCFFPGAMALSMVYTEGLLVVLAIICLVALMRGRWLIAGVVAAAASATSPEGLALFACCAWAAGAAILRRPEETAGREPVAPQTDRTHIDHGVFDGEAAPTTTRSRRRWLALIAPLLAPLGWLTYQGYLWRRTGDLTIWYTVEKKFWRGGFDPWEATFGKLGKALQHPGVFDYLVPSVGLIVLIVAAVLLWRWKPPAVVTIYAAATMAFVIASGALGARPRFFIAAFPFIVALARPIRGAAFHALLGLSALSLGLLTIILVSGVSPSLAFTP